MTSLFSKPRALTSLVSHFKTYRPITGKLHVATLTLLLFLVAAAVAVTSSLWLSKTTKQFDRPTLVTTKPVPELESPQKTGVLVNCTSLLNQNRYGSCSRTSLWLNKTKSYNPPTIITTKPVHAPVPVPEKKSTKKTRISVDCTSFLNQNRSGSCSRTPQPGYNNNQTESNRACPDYFKWIHEDLKPWRKTGITREIVERGQTTAHFRLLIVNGKVFVENYKKSIQTRDAFTLWGILQLLRKYPGKLPDVDLMFDCDDRPVIRSDGYDKSNLTAENAPPVLFRYGGDRWTADIVFPDWSFWGWQEINIKPWSKVLKEMEEGKKKKFMERESYAYWKGNPFVASPSREDLLTCNLSSQHDWNARIFIQPFKNMWKIQVKIIRLWKQYSAAGGETIEMVFVDARGDKIAGTVKRELVGQFNRVLQEGDTKVIINFSVTNSGGSYRPSKHPFKIVFLPTTRVRICEDLPNNLTGLNPVNFGDVLNGVLDDDYLVDVIGQIVEVTQMEIVSVNGKDTQKISVELRNEDDERLPLVLWGKFAEDVSNAIQLRSEQSIVCVLRFGKIKVWKEDRSISNAYNVSNVSLNPQIDEVQAFMSLLPRDDLALAIVDPKSNAVVPTVKERDDFFRHTPRKTISQVLESKQVEKCIVMASIGAIDSDMGWYYLSCKVCAKKVLTVPNDIEDGDEFNVSGHNYYCVKCKDKNPQLLPRYKLHLVVLDSTNDTKFLLFDNLAMQLLHKPCLELTGPVTDEIQDPDMLPPILQDLVGKTLLFKIGIERENYLYKHPTYKVLKIMSNIGVINEFDAIGSPTESQNTFGGTYSALSDAPEGSLMLHGGSSQSDKTGDLTPAKRMRSPIINLEDAFDQNSVTRSAGTVKIKQEKNEKSG